MSEDMLSTNRQSELEEEYIHAFKDGKRVDAIGIIEKNLSKASKTAPQVPLDHLKASRLACLIFEVQLSNLLPRMHVCREFHRNLIGTLRVPFSYTSRYLMTVPWK